MIVASIDIGTNTVLMIIGDYNVAENKLNPILNEHAIPRIGKGLTPGASINENKVNLLLSVLSDYKKIAEEHGSEIILATATNAFRIASNREELITKIKIETGIAVNVVSGDEESFLSYLGASSEDDKESLIVIDIGGGSTEIIIGKGKVISFKKSFPVGVVIATEKFFLSDPPGKDEIAFLIHELKNIFAELKNCHYEWNKCIAIAGTPTTLACIKHNLPEYNEELIEGSQLIKNEIKEMISELSKISSNEILNKFKSVVAGREDILLAGSIILFQLMEILNLEQLNVSTRGIRYGAIVNYFKKE